MTTPMHASIAGDARSRRPHAPKGASLAPNAAPPGKVAMAESFRRIMAGSAPPLLRTDPREETNASCAPSAGGRKSSASSLTGTKSPFRAPPAERGGPGSFYASAREEPAYLRDDPGLACLKSQLGRIDERLRYLDYVRASVDRAEEQCRRELAASLAKSLVVVGPADDARLEGASRPMSPSSDASGWVKHWDAEVGAEYFYNRATGEASWLDPRQGNISV